MARRGSEKSVNSSERPRPREWPGERNPSRWDVHEANEVPGATFVQRFKAALLLSDDARGCQRLVTRLEPDDPPQAAFQSRSLDAPTATEPVRRYTYPMIMLSGLPPLPHPDEIAALQTSFFTFFKTHVFLDVIQVIEASQATVPPYLELALACLASAVSQGSSYQRTLQQNSTSRSPVPHNLFLNGTRLWSVMLEVDNREARLIEAVLSNIFLSTYGTLTSDYETWSITSELLSYITTISRRLHLHDAGSPLYESKAPLKYNMKVNSSLMSYIFLTDVIRAVHFGTVSNYTTCELFFRMPSSPHSFHLIYKRLMTGTDSLPNDIKNEQDALLLLTAILSDILYVYMSLSSPLSPVDTSAGDQVHCRNPHAPLSAKSEHVRLNSMLRLVLDRWLHHFAQAVSKEILSLFYFCKLCLVCSDIWLLPNLANYPPAATTANGEAFTGAVEAPQIAISDEAMNSAWLVLDNINIQPESTETRDLSIWIPIVLFYSALVIWQKLKQGPTSDSRNGTLKVLGMFKKELELLPWECCSEMCRTLDRLMSG